MCLKAGDESANNWGMGWGGISNPHNKIGDLTGYLSLKSDLSYNNIYLNVL